MMSVIKCFLWILSLGILTTAGMLHAQDLSLKNNLRQARAGDYLAISAGKTQTLMHIQDKKENILTVEEIAVPEGKRPSSMTWKEWVARGAPCNTSHVMYDLDLQTGQMLRYYSFTKNNWFTISEADNFLSKLLNLQFTKIAESTRKRVGAKLGSGPELRPIWQPRMIVEGTTIPNVSFDAWRTKWPHDGSELSGKTIEVYLPKDSERYPAYFPYWLQINGGIGKAKIRIIDSGSGMKSSRAAPEEYSRN